MRYSRSLLIIGLVFGHSSGWGAKKFPVRARWKGRNAVPAPYYDGNGDKRDVGIYEGFFASEAKRGKVKQLYYKVAVPRPVDSASNRKIVVFVPGLKDHIGNYIDQTFSASTIYPAVGLNQLLETDGEKSGTQYEFWGYDQPHHGRSGLLEVSAGEKPTGRVDSISENVGHLHNFLALVAQERPGVPILLFGHSMGGLVVASYLQKYGTSIPIQGVVLSAPALKNFAGFFSSTQEFAVNHVAYHAPAWAPAVPDFLPNRGFFDDRVEKNAARFAFDGNAYIQYFLKNDPLIHDGLHTLKTAHSLIVGIDRFATKIPNANFNVPVLIFHAEGDRITNPDGSREFVSFLQANASTMPRAALLSEVQIVRGVRFHALPILYRAEMAAKINEWQKGL